MQATTNRRPGPGIALELLGTDSVDTRAYHGHPGDLIRIDPFALFKVDKVLAAIRAEKAGVVERGLAKLDPETRQWLYTTTAENPAKEDWSITATAVRSGKDDMPSSRVWCRQSNWLSVSWLPISVTSTSGLAPVFGGRKRSSGARF